MSIINITVKNKIAQNPTKEIVCGNSGYVVYFDFDEEWTEHTVKTARFSFNSTFIDVVFEGNTVNVPIITNAITCAVGVYAGDLQTTTPAIIKCQKSILCDVGSPADPLPDVYHQIVDLCAEAKEIAESVEERANNGEFDGKDGADGKDAVTEDGTVVSQNADFAEVAEWADGNPNNEDRTGYFVCANVPVDGIVMKKATSIDDVKGVTILAPAFAGNYTKDKLDSNGKLLPKYSFVAIIGFVPVRDNGTCTVGGRCMPDDNGCAIPSSNSMGYQVVNRIDENRVLIIIEPNGDMVQRIKAKIKELQEDNAIQDRKIQSLEESQENFYPQQTYNPTSPLAQSGKAVAEAVDTVVPNDFEVIAEGELTEAVNAINITTDKDGNPLNLQDIVTFYFYSPIHEKTNYVTIYINKKMCGQLSAMKNTTANYSKAIAIFTGVHWETFMIDGGWSSQSNVVMRGINPLIGQYTEQSTDKINSIKLFCFNSTDTMPVGFKYKIYGRRAK